MTKKRKSRRRSDRSTNEEEEFRIRPGTKGVRFCDRVVVFPIIHFTEFTTMEKQSTWYSRQELKAIKKDNRDFMRPPFNNLLYFEVQDNTIEMQTTVRGLECKTLMGALRKRRHKVQAWQTVFFEQQRQNILGYSDPDAVADAYFEITEPCQMAAHMLALRDARESESIFSNLSEPSLFQKENSMVMMQRVRLKEKSSVGLANRPNTTKNLIACTE